MERRVAQLSPRKAELLRALLAEESSAERLASESRLSSSVVRRHMSELQAIGFVETRAQLQPRGRPQLRYRITQEGREQFFARYDLVLEALIGASEDILGTSRAKELFDGAARRLARSVAHPRTRAELLALFQGLGFEPELRGKSGARQLLSHNCPILRVARNHPELTCDAFHSTLLGELLSIPAPSLPQAISRGAPFCIHELDAPLQPAKP